MKRVNIGCGLTPTPGWCNYDNSLSVRLAHHTLLSTMLCRCRLLNAAQQKAITGIRQSATPIEWANAAKRIPLADDSVAVVYTSHMVDMLDRRQIQVFLKEVLRVLVPHGIVRIAVADLRKLAQVYINEGDADSFMERMWLVGTQRSTLVDRLKYLIVGERRHKWMYDGPSLIRLLSSAGFREPRELPAGETTIPDRGALNLYERADESVYVEAFAPGPE